MSRPFNVFAFLFVTLFGIWGCAQGPAGTASRSDGRVQRLEEENRAVAASRDGLRQKLAQAEESQVKLRAELDRLKADAAREKESLSAQVKARTTERDHLSTQFDAFRKNLRDLIGQADAAAPSFGPPRVAGPAPAPAATAVSTVRN